MKAWLVNCSCGRRYYVAILAFFGFCNLYAMRVNLSVAILDMTRDVNETLPNGTVVHKLAEFHEWSDMARGAALSAFFYGYIFTQLPGGWLARRFGGVRIFGAGVFGTGVLTLLTPMLAPLGNGWLIALRIFEGLCEGVGYPSMHGIWSHWAPPSEKTRLVTITFSGSYFGTVIALPLCGALAETWGWRSIFYFFGIVACLWSILWFLTVSETPAQDKRIANSEREFIENSIGFSRDQTVSLMHNGQRLSITSDSDDEDTVLDFRRPSNNRLEQSSLDFFKLGRKIARFPYKNLKPPWLAMLTSLPVWAITIAHFAENWGFYTMLTELPRYVTTLAPKYSLDKASFLSAIPYLLMGIIVQAGGQLADYLVEKRQFSTLFVRKLFNCGAFITQAIFIIATAYCTSVPAALFCVTLAVGLGGFAWSGFSVNHLDLAPQFASLLMGLSNTFATLPGMVSALISGAMVKHEGRLSEWQMVWWLTAGVYIFGAIFYGIFASASRQPWAHMPEGYQQHTDESEPKKEGGVVEMED